MEANTVMPDILIGVLAAVLPILTGVLASYIKRAAANLAAREDATIGAQRLQEIANAIADAVSMTSQTYVDALKAQGKFDAEAQQTAAAKALAACVSMLEYPTVQWLTDTFGDARTYLATKIEAEVRAQKRA